MFFTERKREAKAKPAAPASLKAGAAPAVAALLLLACPGLLLGSPSSALRERPLRIQLAGGGLAGVGVAILAATR
jgi:hypothetical protein